MTDQPLHSEVALQIHKPCPKSWSELIGDEKKRFCGECCLHVHNAAELSRQEAQEIVTGSNTRVCMRIEYDPQGTPIFRDSRLTEVLGARAPLPRALRRTVSLTRWVLSAAAGVLAACTGSTAPAANPNGGEPPSKMGKVCSTELLGDVAVPPDQNLQRMGEAVVVPAPAPQAAPVAPTSSDDH